MPWNDNGHQPQNLGVPAELMMQLKEDQHLFSIDGWWALGIIFPDELEVVQFGVLSYDQGKETMFATDWRTEAETSNFFGCRF